MERYYQTIARIGSGFSALAMLAWFLWPRDTPLLNREEALFAFLVALFIWLMTEFKQSEEIVFRASTQNDIRLARELVSYASDRFKTMLKEHDYSRGIKPQYYSEISSLVQEFEVGTAFFQDRRLQPLFFDFCTELESFREYLAIHSSPESLPGGYLQCIVPFEHQHRELSEQHRIEIDETNRLATKAWERLNPLISRIKKRVPEAFDEPIEYRWFRSKDLYKEL